MTVIFWIVLFAGSSPWRIPAWCSMSAVSYTHLDRYFLDIVTDTLLELDKGKINSYDANYSGYLELKMQREEIYKISDWIIILWHRTGE